MFSSVATIVTDTHSTYVNPAASRQSLAADHRAPDLVGSISRATSQALEHACVGLILVDKRAAVRYVNSIAQPQLSGPALMLQYGHLVAASQTETARLHNAIMAAATRAQEPARDVLLSIPDRTDPQHVLITPLQTIDSINSGGERLAMIVLATKHANVEERHFRKMYGLTPAEARLLTALVNGERLASYAAQTGIRLTTAKTHLQSLFAKTGAKRQADLIRRALSDPMLRPHIAP